MLWDIQMFTWISTKTVPDTSNKSSNTQRTENKTTDVVIRQHSRGLVKMDILMSETCWAHNNWNKIANDIKLVFHSSTIAMMHGPINIRGVYVWCVYASILCIDDGDPVGCNSLCYEWGGLVRGAAHEEFVCEVVYELADWDHLEVSVKVWYGYRWHCNTAHAL